MTRPLAIPENQVRSIPYVWAAFLAIAAGLLLADWMGLVCISLLRDAH